MDEYRFQIFVCQTRLPAVGKTLVGNTVRQSSDAMRGGERKHPKRGNHWGAEGSKGKWECFPILHTSVMQLMPMAMWKELNYPFIAKGLSPKDILLWDNGLTRKSLCQSLVIQVWTFLLFSPDSNCREGQSAKPSHFGDLSWRSKVQMNASSHSIELSEVFK